MNFYIKEWPDDTATLMTERGRVVWIFPSVEEAAAAAQNWDEIMQFKNGTSENNKSASASWREDRTRRSAAGAGKSSLRVIGETVRR